MWVLVFKLQGSHYKINKNKFQNFATWQIWWHAFTWKIRNGKLQVQFTRSFYLEVNYENLQVL